MSNLGKKTIIELDSSKKVSQTERASNHRDNLIGIINFLNLKIQNSMLKKKNYLSKNLGETMI